MVNKAGAKLRAQLADPDRIIVCPGVQDGLSARVCLQQGFENLYMTGAGTAVSLLGMPDLGLTTADDMVRNAAIIAGLDRTVPVIADADTGFGGPVMVARSVERYILAGVAGLHIEDQVTTKRCGHLQGKELVDADVFASRIRATVAARKRLDDDIVIIARTDALQSRGLDEALARLRAAVAAGADVVFLEGMTTADEMEQVVQRMVPTPCLLNMVAGGVTPLVDAQEAKRMGYKIVIWPLFALTSTYLALQKTAQELKSTGAIKDRLGPDGKTVAGGVREIFQLCGLSECAEFDKEMSGKAFTDGV
ncbi:Phosphoenolpyruvate/pyruvate domain-containing protein [Lasiosphaeria miniovina]|uniref:Phosphoenolpyruvate/pyruvate domain-containing protein n=1 Tax=Lasiosphaeria miniovina TaxID=1954250 RepID=A0AA40AW80_9PEZI|nr:Phosphoenolpyruvate/pyruvate domain-containing protein [Lasiosphaeria miniovina]KAK0723074.1 Phosphoenolpyruvate/pyruvate domain-containing protein [Lasiosphaeria miniovina]